LHQRVIETHIQNKRRLNAYAIFKTLMVSTNMDFALCRLQHVQQALCVPLADNLAPFRVWMEDTIRKEERVCTFKGFEERGIDRTEDDGIVW
jgi:hypothetical protein